MTLLIITSVLVILVSYIAYVIRCRIEYYKLREKVGLKGPDTHWFLGNLKDIVG